MSSADIHPADAKAEATMEHHDASSDNVTASRRDRDSTDSDSMSINLAALGDDLPPGYFYSLNFLGTLTVRRLHSPMSLYITIMLTLAGLLSVCHQRIHVCHSAHQHFELHQPGYWPQ